VKAHRRPLRGNGFKANGAGGGGRVGGGVGGGGVGEGGVRRGRGGWGVWFGGGGGAARGGGRSFGGGAGGGGVRRTPGREKGGPDRSTGCGRKAILEGWGWKVRTGAEGPWGWRAVNEGVKEKKGVCILPAGRVEA